MGVYLDGRPFSRRVSLVKKALRGTNAHGADIGAKDQSDSVASATATAKQSAYLPAIAVPVSAGFRLLSPPTIWISQYFLR